MADAVEVLPDVDVVFLGRAVDDMAVYRSDDVELAATQQVPLDLPTQCAFCGESWDGHDQAACDTKMRAWRPVGLFGSGGPAGGDS